MNTTNQNTLIKTVHGVLLEVHGIGVLLIGQSGIGKSDLALELISRGSKLVSDDVVEVRCSAQNYLKGTSPPRTKHLMVIRGLGILNIKDLYGPDSVSDETQIDLVIELRKWDSDTDYDRLGIDEQSYKIAEIDLPYVVLPISEQRNNALIVEVAAQYQRLNLSDGESKKRIWDQLEQNKYAAGIK